MFEMNIIDNINNLPKGNIQGQISKETPVKEIPVKMQEYKPDVFDFLSEKVVNKNDLSDMVTTPRAIFKGYLCFTVGTTISTIGGFFRNSIIANSLKTLGCLTSIYGTYNFVKPYLIRNDKLTKPEK